MTTHTLRKLASRMSLKAHLGRSLLSPALSALTSLSLSALSLSALTPHQACAQEAPMLNMAGGLPPFLAKMKKHAVLVEVEVSHPDGRVSPAPKDLNVTFRILAQGSKVRDYHEQTDEQGRATFPLIPSNPEVQGMITYEALVDYEGVRFPFELEGVPQTEQPNAPEGALPESRIKLMVSSPHKGLEGVSIHHGVMELHPDEESLLVIHEMTLRNDGDKLLDLSHQPQGGLKLPAPDGAKAPELHQQHLEDLEVRGTALYYTGALPPKSQKQIKWYYTLPYRQDTFEWSQAMPVPATVGIIVAPRYKKPQHQKLFPLSLETWAGPPTESGVVGVPLGEVREVSTGPGRSFHSLRLSDTLKPNQPLTFKILGLPAPPSWKRYALLAGVVIVALFVLLVATKEGDTSEVLSRDHMIMERDRLLKALTRMELALKRGNITPQRYEREREAITARLVTIYRALERFEQAAS